MDKAKIVKVTPHSGAFKKGEARPKGAGRRKGSANKATLEAREAIAMFVQANAGRLQTWLDAIALDDPEKAFQMFQSVIEYHVPKLARTEHAGDGGGPMDMHWTVEFVRPA